MSATAFPPTTITTARGRPLDPAAADQPGPFPYRVLAVGGHLLAGYGVHTHGLALTGTIARALALRVDFGIELRSVLIPDTTAEAIDRVLSFADLTELDALVLVADSPASPLQGEVSIPATVDLLEQLSYRLTPGSSLTWVTGPAAAGVRAQEVQGYLAALRERTSALTRIRMLVKRPPAETAAANYAAWGDAIADTVAGSLIDPLALLPFRAVPTGRAFDVED